MSNIFTYFTVSLRFSSRDDSTAIGNLFQTNTVKWRHGSHSTQTYHFGAIAPKQIPIEEYIVATEQVCSRLPQT